MRFFIRLIRRAEERLERAYSHGKPRLYILPSRFGFMFLLVMAGLLAGSANYNNNLGFLMTFLLGAMTFVSMFHTHGNLAGLTVLSSRSKPVFAGDTAVIEVQLEAGRQARPSVIFNIPGGAAEVVDLKAGRENRVRVPVEAPVRGVLKPESVRLQTVYPIGLFRAWIRIDLDVDVLVYPRPLGEGIAPDFTRSGDGDSDDGGPGVDDFREIRAYQTGDLPQRIAWKQSSRGHGLMTKEFQGQAGRSVMLDWENSGKGDVETRLSRLCAMVLAAGAQGMEYGLRLPGLEITPDTGDTHRHQCLKALALFRLSGSGMGLSS